MNCTCSYRRTSASKREAGNCDCGWANGDALLVFEIPLAPFHAPFVDHLLRGAHSDRSPHTLCMHTRVCAVGREQANMCTLSAEAHARALFGRRHLVDVNRPYLFALLSFPHACAQMSSGAGYHLLDAHFPSTRRNTTRSYLELFAPARHKQKKFYHCACSIHTSLERSTRRACAHIRTRSCSAHFRAVCLQLLVLCVCIALARTHRVRTLLVRYLSVFLYNHQVL